MSYWQSGGGTPQVHDHSDNTKGGNIPQASVTDLVPDLAAKEDALGAPAQDGQVLQSTAAGIRSWATPAGAPDFITVLNEMLTRQALTPVSDHVIEQGDFVGIYLGRHANYNGWGPEGTNYTIPAGKYGYLVAYSGLRTNVPSGDSSTVAFVRSGFSGTIIDRADMPAGSIVLGNPQHTADGLASGPQQRMSAGFVVTLIPWGDNGGAKTVGAWVILGLRDV